MNEKEIPECELDVREEELQKEGYVKVEKAYWRLGRAIFTVSTENLKPNLKDTIDTPLGTAITISGNAEKLLEPETQNLLQNLFGSTGKLIITCEGDPDSHISGFSKIELTGFRGGLDDVIVNGKLLKTVHGSSEDIMRNFADYLYWHTGWLNLPRWETYDGTSYRMKPANSLRKTGRNLSRKIKEFADKLEHKDDMPPRIGV